MKSTRRTTNSEKTYGVRALLALMIVTPLVLSMGIGRAEAATYTVTNTHDSGPGSLRQAIADANATPGDDVIEFAALFGTPQTIALTSGALSVTPGGRVTINGPGADRLTVAGAPTVRVFTIASGADAVISGVKLTGGGGGIWNQGTLTVQRSVVSGHQVTQGAGIYSEGTLTVTASTISENQADAGAAVANVNGTAVIADSTISNNTAALFGAIYSAGGTVAIINSTISGNSSPGHPDVIVASAIYSDFDPITIISTTISNNNMTAVVAPVRMRNSLLFGSAYRLHSEGYNLISGGVITPITGDETGNIYNVDPKLGLLASNGGPTQTHALLPGSPAINAGNPAGTFDLNNNPLSFDQRGTGSPRISGGRLDMGAYELHDNDSDGLPDESDVDDDNDGAVDVADNCPLVANADQFDDDHDGIGNACDATPGSPVEIVFVSTRDSVSWSQLNLEIYGMRADGTGVVRLTNHAAVDLWPALSPDKSRILFTSTRDNNKTEIFVMDVNGANVHRLTTNSFVDGAAVWSPDGTKIAFTSVRNNNADIYVMNVNGSQLTRLTTHAKIDANAAWSPDGQRLAFASNRNGNFDIYTMKVDGTDVRRLTTHNDDDAFPTWSPDGSKIAFASTRDGNAELYVMSASGAAQTRVTNNRAIDAEPAWGANGRILFTSTRGGNTKIYALNPATGVVTQLTNSPNGYDLSPHW